jgi:hypothetical protein
MMLLFAMLSVGYILGAWTACAIYQLRQAEYEDGLSRGRRFHVGGIDEGTSHRAMAWVVIAPETTEGRLAGQNRLQLGSVKSRVQIRVADKPPNLTPIATDEEVLVRADRAALTILSGNVGSLAAAGSS